MTAAPLQTSPQYRRRRRVRVKLRGTATRPRLTVFRSHRHLAVQLVDDEASRTLLALTDTHVPHAARREEKAASPGVALARVLGRRVAEAAKERGITTVVFDRGGYAYHGQVQGVAEGARDGGLKF